MKAKLQRNRKFRRTNKREIQMEPVEEEIFAVRKLGVSGSGSEA
jgi:hypothetical protein